MQGRGVLFRRRRLSERWLGLLGSHELQLGFLTLLVLLELLRKVVVCLAKR
jgi:hypothetical protein